MDYIRPFHTQSGRVRLCEMCSCLTREEECVYGTLYQMNVLLSVKVQNALKKQNFVRFSSHSVQVPLILLDTEVPIPPPPIMTV